MATKQVIDWSDVESAAEALAGNWKEFDSFCWHRAYDLEDADAWMIWYTSHRDAGLLEQSNEKVINERLQPFTEGDDPALVFERHSSWLVGHIDGFSIRVFKADVTTPAFEEFCRIQEELEACSILEESDYSNREYEATLENYRSEMWRLRDELPEGWESQVYSWFSDNHDEFVENRDDAGGWAPRDEILKALDALGLYPPQADQPIIVTNEPSS